MLRINFLVNYMYTVVYYAATGPILSPIKENKKDLPQKKNSCILGNRTFLPPKILKISCTKKFNEFPLGEIGCLNNFHYLLAALASSFLIHHPNAVS